MLSLAQALKGIRDQKKPSFQLIFVSVFGLIAGLTSITVLTVYPLREYLLKVQAYLLKAAFN